MVGQFVGADEALLLLVQIRVYINQPPPLCVLLKASHFYQGRENDNEAHFSRNPKGVTSAMLSGQTICDGLGVEHGITPS
jgi:hypothetical protein